MNKYKYVHYKVVAEGPGVARVKKFLKNKIFEKKKFEIFFLDFLISLYHPRPPLSVHKKFQPNRSSRLAGYREHINECLVLLYR